MGHGTVPLQTVGELASGVFSVLPSQSSSGLHVLLRLHSEIKRPLGPLKIRHSVSDNLLRQTAAMSERFTEVKACNALGSAALSVFDSLVNVSGTLQGGNFLRKLPLGIFRSVRSRIENAVAALPGELEEQLERELSDARIVDDSGGTHVLRSGAGDSAKRPSQAGGGVALVGVVQQVEVFGAEL